MKTATSNPLDRLLTTFRGAMRPPTPFEDAQILIQQAAKDMSDTKRTEADRLNSALRLLCCIPAIGDRLSYDAHREIYSRQGVVPAE